MVTRRIGDVEVTRIEEHYGELFDASFLFPDWTPAALAAHRDWLVPGHYVPATDHFVMSIHSWIIKTRHHTILVDACGGNDKERPNSSAFFHRAQTPYLDRLRAAGVTPEQVDFVLCTHLHVDHVGWNTRLVDGRWVPTFPNAKYVFSTAERDFYDPLRGLPDGKGGLWKGDAKFAPIFEDSVRPVIAAGQDMAIEGAHQLGDGLLIEPSPGHTPGHIVMTLSSRGQHGIFLGDVLHHAIQVYHPDWNSRFCAVPEQARQTRRHLVERCAEDDTKLFAAHFAAPFTGHVRRQGGGFRFVFDEGTA